MFFRLPDISLYEPPVGTPGDPLWQLASQTWSIACGIWETYGREYTGNNPNSAVVRYFWNAVCQLPPTNQPPTLPPSPPFLGGQCCDKTYNLTLNYEAKRCNQNATIASGTGNTQFTGKLKKIEYRNAPSGFNANGLYIEYESCTGVINYANLWSTNRSVAATACFSTNPFDPQADSIDPVASTITNVSIVTADGSPDTCGDIPVPYPPATPPPETNYDITINEGDNEISLPFTWNGDINLPLVFVNPDVIVSFDFQGISIEWSGDFNSNFGGKNPFPSNPPGVKPPRSRPPGGGGSNPTPKSPGVEELPSEDIEPDGELTKEEEKGTEILWILVEVLDIPNNSKYIIENVIPSNTTVFAGYISWTLKDVVDYTSSPEIPLRRLSNLIEKPTQFTGFRVRSTNGAQLRVTTYVQAIPPEITV